ncbi:unnamed protein product [Periconia digitata]|uniref:Polyketide synthase n=1 Tax=Periconia digitata TaxID=1303443 RepID=A0A9W4XDB0_9PLEO|nr:unnamed protein product [Periconia digitata]
MAEQEPLAIVGLAFRLPGDADTPEAFWRIMEERRCVMSEMPEDRFNIDSFYNPDPLRNDTLSLRGAHFMGGKLGAFDASFFSIGPAEAGSMDPQQRGMLESSYHALENAGLPLKSVAGSKTAVFTASFSDDHRVHSLKDPELFSSHSGSATSWSILANRLSWWYDFRGPSVHVDTACSSGLVALHLACQALRNGEANMALVGGSNVLSSVEIFLLMSNLSMLSPSSRSYSFDDRANGYARGEGFGFVVVKKLSDALKNGDTIRAVIRGTGINSDGRTPSLTSPNQDAQEALIRDTYRVAGLDPKDTAFVEAHGTGTPVGDPIEARALGSVFGAARPSGEPVYIGAVKSNIGHLEGGSGIAGLIKSVLAVERAVIPPNTNFENVNPNIDTSALNITFPTECVPWPSTGIRRASVNSFGFGGTNAHVVIDDACGYLKAHNQIGFHQSVDTDLFMGFSPSQPRSGASTPLTPTSWEDLDPSYSTSLPKLLTWSASDEKGVQRVVQAFEHHFAGDSAESYASFSLDSLAYTLTERRSLLQSKSFAVVDSPSDLARLSKLSSTPSKERKPRGVCFVFTGQGAQYSRMGIRLLQYPVFRQSVEQLNDCLRELGCEWNVIEEISKTDENTRVNEPELSQPLCTAIQVALVDLLASFDVTPRMVVGHSSGEIGAAYATGALSAKSAITVAYLRGKAAAALCAADTRGAMMAVGLSEDETNVYLDRYRRENPLAKIVIACNNSPTSVTVAGDDEAIEVVRTQLEDDGMFARKLRIAVAYHSPHVEQVSPLYRSLLEATMIEGRQSNYQCTMVSSVTNQVVEHSQLADPEYWVKNLESPVRFCEAVSNIIKTHHNTRTEGSAAYLDLLEIGPHCALKGPIKNIMAQCLENRFLRYDTVLDRSIDPAHSVLSAVGRLHCLGGSVDLLATNGLHGINKGEIQMIDNLPAYPFDHSVAQWHKSKTYNALAQRKVPRLDLLGLPMIINGPSKMSKRWRKFTRTAETPWVRDHVVSGDVLYPAAGMITMAIEAAKQSADPGRTIKAFRLTDVQMRQALLVPDNKEGVESQIELTAVKSTSKDAEEYFFMLCTLQDDTWVENCTGSICLEYTVDGEDLGMETKTDRAPCTRGVHSTTLYDFFDSMGLGFGPTFQSLTFVATGDQENASSTVSAYPFTGNSSSSRQEHVIHPITLDGIFQTILGALVQGGRRRAPTAVPTKLEELYIDGQGAAAPQTASLQAYAQVLERNTRTTTSNASAWNNEGKLLVVVNGLQTTFVDAVVEDSTAKVDEHLCHQVVWDRDIDFLNYGDATPQHLLPDHLQSLASKQAQREHFANCCKFFAHLCEEILGDVRLEDLTPSRPYLHIYYRWMQEFLAANPTSSELLIPSLDSAMILDRKPLCLSDIIDPESDDGQMFMLAEENIRGILLGTIDPVETLFKSKWAESCYQKMNNDSAKALKHVIELIAFKKPGLKVLEVGAGTGSTTQHVLQYAVSQGWGADGAELSAISTYDFTDVSPSFFPAAKTKFEGVTATMNYLVFDCSRDPAEQGFEAGSYDLIVAANVLHATANLNTTISNVRKLLKKNGKLVLLEITANQWMTQILFGTLPGWWLSEDDYRTSGPCLTDKVWNEVFQKNGFSGTDLVIHSSDDPDCRVCSVIVATAVSGEDKLGKSAPAVSIVIGDDCEEVVLAQEIAQELRRAGCADVVILPLGEAGVRDLSQSLVISLLEYVRPCLISLNEARFYAVRQHLVTAKSVLWVQNTFSGSPVARLSEGLFRVLRSENLGKRFVSYSVSANTPETKIVQNVLRLVQDIASEEESDADSEYQEIDGEMSVCRMVPAPAVEQHMASVAATSTSIATASMGTLDNENACVLDPEATYVVVGGFGGLARTICEWMVNRGARNLLLLSRSGPTSSAAYDLLAKLATRGIRVECPPCDISDATQISNVFTAYASQMPPIRGCIQGALVLQDALFETMAFEQWTATISTRVTGTLNLRAVLPHSMDFFVLLSSLNGLMGMPSQANYAATNTYLDAFAAYYSTPYLPIVSLDLGWMGFAGTVAESQEIQGRMASLQAVRPVEEFEFLGFLDYHCSPANLRSIPTAHQRHNTAIGIHAQNPSPPRSNLLSRPIFRHLLHSASHRASLQSQPTTSQDASAPRFSASTLMRAASSPEEATAAAVAGLRWKVATDLEIPEDDVDPEKPLHEAGVDSLLAVQIKGWVREELKSEVSVFDVMGLKSLSEIGAQIAGASKLVSFATVVVMDEQGAEISS